MGDDLDGHGDRALTWGTRGPPRGEPGDLEDDIGGHGDRGLT